MFWKKEGRVFWEDKVFRVIKDFNDLIDSNDPNDFNATLPVPVWP